MRPEYDERWFASRATAGIRGLKAYDPGHDVVAMRQRERIVPPVPPPAAGSNSAKTTLVLPTSTSSSMAQFLSSATSPAWMTRTEPSAKRSRNAP